MEELRLKLKELIQDIPQLFEQLKTELSASSPLFNEVCLQEKRFTENKNEYQAGRLSDEHAGLENRKIDKAIIDLIDAIQPTDRKENSGQQLNHSHIYLCDRVAQNDAFTQASMVKLKDKSRFFYLYGFYKEKHKSLFERFSMDFQAGGSKVINLEIPITFSQNMDVFKVNFLKEFLRKFEIHINEQEPLLDKDLGWLCNTSVPLQGLDENDYVCAFIHISEWDWDSQLTPDLTRWFIHDFCETELPANSPNFLFFFAVSYEEDDSPVEAEVRKLIEESETVIGLPELEKVGFRDIAQWFSRFNFVKIKEKDAATLRNENFNRSESYHMDTVEIELRKIIDQFNEQFI